MDRTRQAKQEILADTEYSVSELPAAGAASIDRWKDSSFGFSLRAFLLYGQCGDSSRRSPGLVVTTGEAAFAVGLFERADGLSAHLIAPRGAHWCDAVSSFARRLLRKQLVDCVYVRHLNTGQAEALRRAGFANIGQRPWLTDAPSEDETYNHRLVHLDEVLSSDSATLVINKLNREGSKNFRSKFRLAYSRFSNFLSRSGVQYHLRPMRDTDYQHGRKIVASHFKHLEASGKAIGSTALDYEMLLTHPLPDNSDFVSMIGYLEQDGRQTPVSVFLGERTGENAGALYLTITQRDADTLRELAVDDARGYSAISQYSFGQIFACVRDRGWKTVDLGGSETADLDRFKRQMGATLHATQWVYLDNQHRNASDNARTATRIIK